MQTIRQVLSTTSQKDWKLFFVSFLIVGVIIGSFIVDLKGLLLVPYLFSIWKERNKNKVINL